MRPHFSLIYSFILLFLAAGKMSSADLPVIGITEITSGVDVRNYREYKNSKAGNFQTMLETQMVKVGRFKIMERNRLGEVLGEQGLQGEFSDAGTVMNISAVDYLVYGSITKFGTKKKEISTHAFPRACAPTALELIHCTSRCEHPPTSISSCALALALALTGHSWRLIRSCVCVCDKRSATASLLPSAIGGGIKPG